MTPRRGEIWSTVHGTTCEVLDVVGPRYTVLFDGYQCSNTVTRTELITKLRP